MIAEALSRSLAVRGRGSRRIGAVSRLLTPGLGACMHCETTWAFVRARVVRYSDEGRRGRSCFALCEPCWAELPVDARLVYHRALYETWLAAARRIERIEDRTVEVVRLMDSWRLIEAAVRAS